MDEESLIIIIPVTVLLLVFIVRRSLRVIRAKQLEKVAYALSLSYKAIEKNYEFIKTDFSVFTGIDTRRRVENVITVTESKMPFCIFDYYYASKKRKNTKRTIALFESSALQLPRFKLSPTTWKDKVNSAMGIKDINFEDNPMFSKKYFLEGEDEELIRRVFSHKALTFFAKNADWTVEAKNGKMIVFYKDHYTAPKNLKIFMEEVQDIASLFTSL